MPMTNEEAILLIKKIALIILYFYLCRKWLLIRGISREQIYRSSKTKKPSMIRSTKIRVTIITSAIGSEKTTQGKDYKFN
jgi:hypothetical protein